ncbi:MAG: hypothetical protein L6V93_00690 [Clostridiales bacterium]|nr:MAG: hypothetical protein L6V93_00690 [Clostridiales bacterium]
MRTLKKLTNVSKDEYGIAFPMKWDTWVTSDMLSPGFSSVGFDGYNPVTGEYDYTGYEPIFNAVMQIKGKTSLTFPVPKAWITTLLEQSLPRAKSV